MNRPPASDILRQAQLHNTAWGERIIRAEKDNTPFSEEAKIEASSWRTCVCSQFMGIERSPLTHCPLDRQLAWAGGRFEMAIKNNWPQQAAFLLVQMYQRAFLLTGEPQ